MAQPTAMEQEMLELLNRFRLNPAAELSLLLNTTDPNILNALSYFNVNITELTNQWSTLVAAQPLAWSNALNDVAKVHNDLMISYDQQSHSLPGEASLGSRITNAGYSNWTTYGENVFAYATSVFYAHAGFAIDWGNTPTGIQTPAGHRNSMMNNSFREVGLSITPENNSSTSVGPLVVTQDFANRQALNNKGYILGVAYRDWDRDNFYDAGEGLADVQINVTRLNTTTPLSQSFNTLNAGGYQTLLDPGSYLVRFFREGVLQQSRVMAINATNVANVKLDLKITTTAPSAGLGQIAGVVFNDLNGNGVLDQWEPVQRNWRVFLDTNNNKVFDTGETSVLTNANGEYVFNNLAPGTYTVAEVLQSGWQQSFPNPNNPVGFETYRLDDGNSNGAIAYTTGDTLIFNAFTAKSASEVINSISVGLSSYGNPKAIYLYQDSNANNKPESSEKILELAVNLTGSSGLVNVPITPTTVSGTFFVGALYGGNNSSYTYIPRDTDSLAGKSWLSTSTASNFSAFTVSSVNWLLRANTAGALPQTITVQANQARSQVNFGNRETANPNRPYLFINNALITEGNSGSSNAVFTVTLSQATNQIVTVNYATSSTNRTAASGSDYTAVSGALTFNPGETSKSINVAILGDTVSEADETFVVNLSNAVNAGLGDSQGIGTILSDDTPSLAINDLTFVEGQSSQATVTVSLNTAATQTITVNYSTSPGTAILTSDYTAASGTLTFAAGATKQTFKINIANDAINELDKTINLNLSSPTNALLSKATGILTITDTLQASTTTTLAANIENLTLTGTATVNGTGNAGHNILTGNSANNVLLGLDGNDQLIGAGGKDSLTGGNGSDRFNYKNLTDSLLANYDKITDFNANSGNDLFVVNTLPTQLINVGAVSGLNAINIGNQLTTTNFLGNMAATFTVGSQSFLAINDAIAGFNANTDSIIEITGLTGTLGVNHFVLA